MSEPYYVDASVTLYHGDALDVLRSLDTDSIDAVCTDPPYGLEFMGREWDSFKPSAARLRARVDGRTNPSGGKSTTTTPEAYVAGVPYQQWCQAWAVECLRVLKPGAHLLAFGGTRTVHRLTCAIEDAGFEIRDGIDWLYAAGFPKSLAVDKAIDKAAGAVREVVGPNRFAHLNGKANADVYGAASRPGETTAATDAAARWSGWGTALKPAREPIVVARKPLQGTVAANVLRYGTGALNIDDCRVPATSENARADKGRGLGYMGGDAERGAWDGAAGRWPSNVVLSHADTCGTECAPGCPVAELDAQSGPNRGSFLPAGRLYDGKDKTRDVYGTYDRTQTFSYGDTGAASRFFPVFRYEAKADSSERPRVNGVAHPTVKPLALMRWLVRLVTPPGGTVLDPFAGSGTTGEACVVEGFRAVLVEREADYLPLIVSRLSKPLQPVLNLEEMS